MQSGCELRFAEQGIGLLAFEAQYEPRCYSRGEVQTRTDNWHDLLNALVWLTYPKAKAAINARHYHALTDVAASSETRSERGATRDTSTLLDESGVTAVITGLLVPCKDRCHTITFDNGKEFADHQTMAEALKADIYFAHPCHLTVRI